MRKLRIGLLPKIILAIILGVGFGNLFSFPFIRIFVTFNALFSELLSFSIPLIILGLVTVAIADIGKGAGKILLITVGIAYLATITSGLFAYLAGDAFFPSLITPGAGVSDITHSEGAQPYFTISIPPMMSVMTSLVLSFVLGLGLAGMESRGMKGFMQDFQKIITMLISNVIIPLLPLYIFGIFLNMTHQGEVAKVMSVFLSIIGIIFGLHILLLIAQYSIAGLITRKNPFKMLWKMMPAYFTALGTQSSAATIPVTMKSAIKCGVSEEIAGFTIPLCATIHLSGSTLKITCCALALMIMQGMPYDIGLFMGFILMLGITMVAAPGVPGGAIMAALGVLQSMLGFDESMQALMIALYITMDNFGTACNVTGDGAISLIVDKIMKRKSISAKAA